ncbi:MAG: hypothetical protein IT545_04485 [Rhodobacteraceae bacterium]|nr:hypothetical protein [Paracoccaceae bacterium]
MPRVSDVRPTVRGLAAGFFLAVTAGGGAPVAAQPTGTVHFPLPVSDGVRVDWCATWASNCGQGGADGFCMAAGLGPAVGWAWEYASPTRVLGDGQTCTSGCGALKDVTCTAAYAVPRVGGERVDWCATWATDCGQGGADGFCRSQGHGRASAWAWETTQRTLVLGGNQICQGSCGALKDVVCTAAAVAPPPPPPPPPVTGGSYARPRIEGERVDWCATWATDCGQGGADGFCRAKGHGPATAWEWEYVSRTLVLGGHQICQGSCGALKNVVCAPAAMPAIFVEPRIGGERVDWCAAWATDCGQGGANGFCRAAGYSVATAWEWETTPRTLVLGGNQICQGSCGALKNVVCN